MTATDELLRVLHEVAVRELRGEVATERHRADTAEAEAYKLRGELAAKEQRIQELLQSMVRITHETPYPEEAEENRQRVGVLVAQVGTLKRELAAERAAHAKTARELAVLREAVAPAMPMLRSAHTLGCSIYQWPEQHTLPTRTGTCDCGTAARAGKIHDALAQPPADDAGQEGET